MLFIAYAANATTYYLSASGNDVANGTSASTPWQTINKLNGFNNLKPGDLVLFNRGDTFYGALSINVSGTAGGVISYGSYGAGANPVITGFTNVSSWTNLGGNIWESTSSVSTLSTCNMVVVNGVNAVMGRYPNTGYLTFQSHSGNTSITCSSLTGAPNWTGAEVVIKKNRWVIDRNIITSQSGGTLNYTSGSLYNGQDKFGFFIQNDSRTLDTLDEWYYNPSTQKIRIYSISMPSGVQVSTVDTLVSMVYKNYVTFNNISFSGANKIAIYVGSCANLSIQNCNINFCNNGIFGTNWGGSSANFLLQNSTINHTNNNAVNISSEFANAMVSNNTIKNTGEIAGMGASGDGMYQAIYVAGNNSMAQNNEVDSTGYNGIAFDGAAITIQKNLVNYSCLVKDDGGGIYTANNSLGKIIQYNTVLNTIGTGAGTDDPTNNRANGIYIDQGNGTNGVSVLHNNIANAGWYGIFEHDGINTTIKYNTVYNSGNAQITVANDVSSPPIRGLVMQGNIYMSELATEDAARFYTLDNDIASWGTIDSNYYTRPINDSLTIHVLPSGDGSDAFKTLPQWQSYSGYDAHSYKSPKAITNTGDLLFEYNATSSPSTISLTNNYTDVKGANYNGTITLAPYSSAVLIRGGAITNQPPKANAGPDQTIILPLNAINLSGSGTDPDGTISSYLWTKIYGPTPCTISNINSASTSVIGLVQGVYKFELEVTDNNGAVGRDTMQLTVSAAAVIPPAADAPPVANAGSDISLTLPANTVALNGGGTDADGTITNYLWTKISGPSSYNIVNASAPVTDVSGLIKGVYEFELTVTGNNGEAGRDTMQVTLSAAADTSRTAADIPPIANGGSDISLTLPTNNALLNGSGTDASGTITNYSWTKISGPTSYNIADASSAVTDVSSLVLGVYEFVLAVTNNGGEVGRDTMQVTVGNAVDVAPVADAGQDDTVTLPTNAILLSGSGTDAEGVIVGYSWKQISGPYVSWIEAPNSPVTLANGLLAGNYEFQLTVTDNMGAIGRDTVVVVVDLPGLNHGVQSNNIKIYPNPVVGMATLEINTTHANSKLLLVITNMQGQIVYRSELASEQNSIQDKIDLSNLAKGAYVLVVYFPDQEKQTLKVVRMN